MRHNVYAHYGDLHVQTSVVLDWGLPVVIPSFSAQHDLHADLASPFVHPTFLYLFASGTITAISATCSTFIIPEYKLFLRS